MVPWLRRKWSGGQRGVAIVVGGLYGLSLIAVVSGIASSSSNKSPTTAASSSPSATPAAASAPPKPQIPKSERDARAWIKDHGGDSYRVQANVLNAEIAAAPLAKSVTQAKLDQAAQAAQTAHDDLDAIRSNFALGSQDSGALGNAELFASSGANDLKNSMGALVALAGTPNAATVAHFNAQFGQAKSEWNQSVRTIWRIAHRKHPPTV
jgi:hypothetical protein